MEKSRKLAPVTSSLLSPKERERTSAALFDDEADDYIVPAHKAPRAKRQSSNKFDIEGGEYEEDEEEKTVAQRGDGTRSNESPSSSDEPSSSLSSSHSGSRSSSSQSDSGSSVDDSDDLLRIKNYKNKPVKRIAERAVNPSAEGTAPIAEVKESDVENEGESDDDVEDDDDRDEDFFKGRRNRATHTKPSSQSSANESTKRKTPKRRKYAAEETFPSMHLEDSKCKAKIMYCPQCVAVLQFVSKKKPEVTPKGSASMHLKWHEQHRMEIQNDPLFQRVMTSKQEAPGKYFPGCGCRTGCAQCQLHTTVYFGTWQTGGEITFERCTVDPNVQFSPETILRLNSEKKDEIKSLSQLLASSTSSRGLKRARDSDDELDLPADSSDQMEVAHTEQDEQEEKEKQPQKEKVEEEENLEPPKKKARVEEAPQPKVEMGAEQVDVKPSVASLQASLANVEHAAMDEEPQQSSQETSWSSDATAQELVYFQCAISKRIDDELSRKAQLDRITQREQELDHKLMLVVQEMQRLTTAATTKVDINKLNLKTEEYMELDAQKNKVLKEKEQVQRPLLDINKLRELFES